MIDERFIRADRSNVGSEAVTAIFSFLFPLHFTPINALTVAIESMKMVKRCLILYIFIVFVLSTLVFLEETFVLRYEPSAITL